MKPVDLNSLIQASASLDKGLLDSYLEHYGIEMNSGELSDLKILVSALLVAGAKIGDLAGFYVGYQVPQIGKEFDLLRFGDASIFNIELKSESTPEKIEAQLRRNHYYLSFLACPIEAFTFESSSAKIYRLSEERELEESDAAVLLAALRKHKLGSGVDPDELFNPSDFLVSPFNSTDRFLMDGYFLTHQQEEIRHKVLSSIAAATGAIFVGITGAAGTGKTLLTFDIAKRLHHKGKEVLIVHCGLLNAGHQRLEKEGWRIVSIKNYRSCDFSAVDLLVVDEVQRIKKTQLEDIVAKVSSAKCACIFSFDRAQTLATWEDSSDISEEIKSIPSIAIYKLSKKIRTNKEIADFIIMLFNARASTTKSVSPNITINYFDNNEDAKSYLAGLAATNWEVLRFTPSQYENEHHERCFDASSQTSHQVIGQEFDQVAIAMDKFFAYDAEGDLSYRGKSYYAATKMLFQNITRARRRLALVVIDNPEILKRCLDILTP
jgi:hypothetical protein